MRNKPIPKYKDGDVVKYTTKTGDIFYGRIAYTIISDIVAYGVLLDWDLKVYHFPEKVLEKE